MILRPDDVVAGFLITQQLAEGETPTPAGQGLQFKVPTRAASSAEPTYVFADSLEAALSYKTIRGTVSE